MYYSLVKTRTWVYLTRFGLILGRWTHILLRWHDDAVNPSQSTKIYVNGVPISAQTTFTAAIENFENESLFNDIHVGGPNNLPSYMANCSFDELLFWDYEVSPDDVTDIYNTYQGLIIIY
jgi:ligand-binding SRPBCC domain-containing protein